MLHNLGRKRIKRIREELPNRVEVLITDATKLALCACDEVSRTVLLTKKSHLTKEFARIEIAQHHFLLWVFDIVDDQRERTIRDEVEVLTGFALTEYDRPRFY